MRVINLLFNSSKENVAQSGSLLLKQRGGLIGKEPRSGRISPMPEAATAADLFSTFSPHEALPHFGAF